MGVTWREGKFELVLEQEQIRFETGIETIDESWKFTDAAGHQHYYSSKDGYSTLEYIVDTSHWCAGDEGMGPHDPHEAVDESHYECKICREVIEPGRHPAGHVGNIPGPLSATLTGYRTDGCRVVVRLLEEEYKDLQEHRGNESVWKQLLDAVPEDRVLSWSKEVL